MKKTAIVLLALLSTAQAASSPFSGKILVIYTEGAGLYHPRAVSRCELRELGGHQFIVGRIVKYVEGVYDAGKTVWISVASISQIVEYDTEDEVREAMKVGQKHAQQYYQRPNRSNRRDSR